MEITIELLAAYAENKVTDEERIKIREYLVEHPEEIESVMMMMDDDYDLYLSSVAANRDKACRRDTSSVLNLKKNSAAFAPVTTSSSLPCCEIKHTRQGVSVMLSKLLNDLM